MLSSAVKTQLKAPKATSCLSQCLYGISKFILDLECTSLDVNFRASNSFGSDLFSQLWSDRRTGANILLSPQSIFSALSLLHLGARQSPPLSLVEILRDTVF